MKKLFTFLLTAFIISLSVNAQISITSSNMPGSGDTLRYSNCSPQSVNTTITGPNVFWNYDTLHPQSQGLYEYKASYLTPYALWFIGFNQYGLKVADSVGFGTFKFYDIYNFYKKTSADYTVEGTGFKYQGVPLAANHSDEDEIYTFPLNYLDHDSTTYKVSVSLGTGISYTQFGYRINDVDGWGVIKTPFDSVACLRLVSTSYGKDSINFNGFGFSYPNVQRAYKWMSTSQKIPVLEVSGPYLGGNFAPATARYRDSIRTFVGINEPVIQEGIIKVFPNPAKEEAYVFVKDADVSTIKFFNLSGQLIMTKKVSDVITTVSVKDLENGIYFYSALDSKGNYIASGKILVTHD